MVTIGIEINHVVRNINKQLLKYYKKDFDPSIDLDEIDEKDNVIDKYIKFDSKAEKKEFVYIDYPYEIFGCAKPMDKNLPTQINGWLAEMTNREDDEYRVVYYSMDEEALTIQSTFFFLSKIGTRVREVLFPQSIDEIYDKFDVIITSNDSVIDNVDNVVKVKIDREWNEECKSDFNYQSLTDVIKDDEFLDKIFTRHNELKEKSYE